MEVVVVPVFHDNYAYLVVDTSQKIAAAVDPYDATKVYEVAKQHNLRIEMILTTHGHYDHHGGNTSLVQLIQQQENRAIEVYGGEEDQVQAMTKPLDHNDTVQLGQLHIQVFKTPCHTRGHLLFLCGDALFTGDTLFVAGCGRFFAGTAQEMHHALNKVIASLAPMTKIYCGHEYTVKNLEFALQVEPDNEAAKQKLAVARAKRQAQEPTIPSTIQEELETNPFMRVNQPQVQKFAGCEDEVEVMTIVRRAKDQF